MGTSWFLTVLGTGNKVDRKPGERWLVVGPKEYMPPLEVKLYPAGVTIIGNYRLDFLVFYFVLGLISIFLYWLL